ncbi:23 kDa integral membrane protein-like isoform X1 [Bradysia coprophila]|uniref:23 kDa integral membrane protein-like isoform X1 n=1 Tax=Bradysia coprophila TaxID=38358 RepID=UPI00187D8CBD|nr:23 kDa integral membrane protein-like isoform X1 [Bradysia coprophila]
MGMGCGMSMVKYILFVFNLLCALGGVAILGVGIAFLLRIGDIEKIFDDWNVQVVPILFIVIGAIIFIVAFFGCCGAIKESHCMTVTYSTFLMIMLLAQIVLAIVVFVYIGDLQEAVRPVLARMWEQRPNNPQVWDSLQRTLQCCGLNNPAEWGTGIPTSCCADGTQQCNAGTAFQTGCSGAVNDFISTSGNIIGAVALGVAGIELIGFIFACCLANSIRNQSRRSAYQ